MHIRFDGKFKSITNFEWLDVPPLAVLTGPNGTGKSQLLQLIYQTIIEKKGTNERVSIKGVSIGRHEVTYLHGEWRLQNTGHIDLASLQSQMTNFYNEFVNNKIGANDENKIRLYHACEDVLERSGKKKPGDLTRDEFYELFPEFFIEQERELSKKIGELFLDYRISEIELQAKGHDEQQIRNELGEKPWIALREIAKESKLPFQFSDPADKGIREGFQFVISNEVTGEVVNFNDLSSGERVIISLVFYLYSSQEKNAFPKLLLIDEPDAHLHPTMTQQFLNVIKNVLVDKYGVRVIMTTHSPSTVVLAPEESVFEMQREPPRIQKSRSRNHTVSLLTTGIVFVGEGTRFLLVEDSDDAYFYSHLYTALTANGYLSGEIPLVFIPASTSTKSGGKNAVLDWVEKLQKSGLEQIIHGIIDRDNQNHTSPGVYLLGRYSIENYLIDPIIIYATLLDHERHFAVPEIQLKMGEEYKLKNLPEEKLQYIADTIFEKVEGKLDNYFDDFDATRELERVSVDFVNGVTLKYPKWMLERKGKNILNCVYGEEFSNHIVNHKALVKSLRKIELIPVEIIELFERIRTPSGA